MKTPEPLNSALFSKPSSQIDLTHWLGAETSQPWLDEHDSCAIVASVRKNGEATHGNLKRALAALGIMGHRSGDVNGEGDGCGVMTDIPRRLWAESLERRGKACLVGGRPPVFCGPFHDSQA